jgi:uncharacterized membrane protein YecN with MAPEG domain
LLVLLRHDPPFAEVSPAFILLALVRAVMYPQSKAVWICGAALAVGAMLDLIL